MIKRMDNFIEQRTLREMIQSTYKTYGGIKNEFFVPQILKDMRKRINELRKLSRTVNTRKYKHIEEHMIVELARSETDGLPLHVAGKSVSFNIIVDKDISAKSGSKYRHTIKLGHMWRHKVYIPLLRMNCLGKETRLYFILNAEQYGVNVKNINLYKVMIYRYKTRKVEHGYIGQSAIGSCKAKYAPTISLAISEARKLAAKEVAINLGVKGVKHD